MEHTFNIKIEGSNTRREFTGTFTYKRPNIRIQSDIAKTTAKLNEDLRNLDEDTKFLHSVLAKLRHTLTDTPEWWQKSDYGYELFDINVVLGIYKSCQEFETEWFNKVWAEKDESKDDKVQS
jgi:hypothetical protein